MLKNVRPEDAARYPEVGALIRAIRDSVPPLTPGEKVMKVLTPEQAEQMIKGLCPNGKERPKDLITGFFTRSKYLDDVHTPDDMVSRLRLDYPGGMPREGNTEVFFIEFEYNGRGYHVPQASTLDGGVINLGQTDPPFTGTGWLGNDDGHWVPEFRFGREGHPVRDGIIMKRLNADGTVTPYKRLVGGNWVDMDNWDI